MTFEDRYGPLDRLPHRIAFRITDVQHALADLEEKLYREELQDVDLEHPVFVSGLPRSGTTILLELLWDTDRFASHTYRDVPFVLCPILWQRFARHFTVEDASQERAHGDGLQVSRDSPEAFEEMLWKRFWPSHYRDDRIEPWSPSDRDREFDAFLQSNMQKVILLRRADASDRRRYLSKNNMIVARLPALPDAMQSDSLMVPFREPVQHTASLLQQHRRFTAIHERNQFVRRYMEWIGHHEFGKGLRPVDFGDWLDNALTAWRAYNRGAAVEGRIKELGQLSVGRTAVDDLDGNALLWALGTLAYQMLHGVRTLALSGPWRVAQPDRLRNWLFRMPGRGEVRLTPRSSRTRPLICTVPDPPQDRKSVESSKGVLFTPPPAATMPVVQDPG